jgi:hypothetical protein
MIKTGTLLAGALIAVVSFSAVASAQSLSRYDRQQQRADDIKEMTTDSGVNTLDHPLDQAPWGVDAGPSRTDRQYQGLYREPAPRHRKTNH